jgi:hypothetical protein
VNTHINLTINLPQRSWLVLALPTESETALQTPNAADNHTNHPPAAIAVRRRVRLPDVLVETTMTIATRPPSTTDGTATTTRGGTEIEM